MRVYRTLFIFNKTGVRIMRTTIHIVTKDRASELSLLLDSIRTQTYQNFDVIILDDSRPQPVINSHSHVQTLVNRLKDDGHKVIYQTSPEILGVCHARNYCFEIDNTNNPLVLRVDDDTILESDYIERLVNVMKDKGVGAVGGVVPNLMPPRFIRNTDMVKTFNKVTLDPFEMKDDGGFEYDKEAILDSHHLRSSFMIRREIHNQIGKYPTDYSPVGFREETDYSFRILLAGWKLKTDVKAIAWHLRCPSGGTRNPNYVASVQMDDLWFKKKIKNWNLKEVLV